MLEDKGPEKMALDKKCIPRVEAAHNKFDDCLRLNLLPKMLSDSELALDIDVNMADMWIDLALVPFDVMRS
jgi:hypothetical protein